MERDGLRELAIGVLLQALKDAVRKPKKGFGNEHFNLNYRNDAVHFLVDKDEEGRHFWCAIAGLDEEAVREKSIAAMRHPGRTLRAFARHGGRPPDAVGGEI